METRMFHSVAILNIQVPYSRHQILLRYEYKIQGTRYIYNHDIIFLEQIPYDFEMCEDKEYVKSVKQRMFIDPFGEDVADYYILNIARGLAGDAMKRCLFGIGDGNTGKSRFQSFTFT